MSRHTALRLAFVGAFLSLVAGSLRAQCSFPDATRVTWPGVNPVWDFCFRPPSLSSGANGSGLELTDVRYRGTRIFHQAHIPILNVKYAANSGNIPGPCGGPNLCYRDWFFTQTEFECAPVVSPGVCTGTTTPAKTVCEDPGEDLGTFNGVAVESLPDRLKLTAQTQAGWYRYIPIWEFFADGTIQAKFAATSIDHTCVAFTHHHHAYFRFDLDVDGGAGDSVDAILSDGSPLRVTTERKFVDTSPARSKWRVASAGSPYVVEITRNAGDGAAGDPLPIPGDFPQGDGWVLAYDPNEIADYSNVFSGCAANIDPWDDDENVNGADVVMWVRAAGLHEGEAGGEAHHCEMAGPTIKVVPTPPVATRFHTLAPCRAVDTRLATGTHGGPAISPASPRSFVLTAQCGVPASAKSVSVNLTAVSAAATGHLVAFPSGGSVPDTSTLNFSAGRTRANNAILALGAGGAVTVETSATVHVVIDVNGWFE
ncbi:MAG TPA: hypothetical protein VFF17_11760 [Thermoanaerobaculia bacterium]|nr:hypothetical protein [Thermoanaerobaculia bacterium]